MRLEPASPLTLVEHQELGREIRATRARTKELCELIVEVYGPNNRAAFSFEKVVEAMERLCQDLQTQAVRDCPGCDTESLYA